MVIAGFEAFDDTDVADLIAEYPLAWVSAADGDADHASLLPLLGEYGSDGRLTHLLGHMGRRNPLFACLSASPSALILFQGPQAYVGPEHAGRRDWAPTWNYAQLRVEAEVAFLPDATGPAVDTLVAAMDAADTGWTIAELGARYDGMLRSIIAFRARVTRVRGRFKLGQDEPRAVFDTILARHGDAALVRWMRRFDRGNG